VGQNGEGFTFCYDVYGLLNGNTRVPIVTQWTGNKAVLYPQDNPDWQHTVTWFQIGNSDPAEEIRRRFMTEDNRAACEVVSNPGAMWNEYVIAGGDLEAQEKCGEFRYGFFIQKFEAPNVLYFVTTGQDTFMLTQSWLQTLEKVEGGAPNTDLSPTNSTSGGLAWHNDGEFGLAFSYPAMWGPLVVREELGCYQRIASFTGAGDQETVFLVEGSTEECEPAGRGGYFGDVTNTLKTWDDISAWCHAHDSCETFQNASGIQIAHAYTKSLDSWGNKLSDVDEYAFVVGNDRTAIVSNERLVQNGLGRQQDAMRVLVDTISLRPFGP
jgi:hypothetical protein